MNEVIAAAKGCRGRGTLYSRMKREWNARVSAAATAAGMTPMRSAHVSLFWWETSKRRDPDNFLASKKFVLDGLVDALVLPNDGWGEVLSLAEQWGVSKKPGVHVVLDGSPIWGAK